MGRVKRFSTIETAISKYKATGAAGSPIAKYKTFKTKGTGYVYNVNGTPSLAKEVRSVLPFGERSTGSRIITTMGGRALATAGLTATGMTQAILGLTVVAAADVQNSGFIPAKAIIKVGNTVGTAKASQITGVSYTPRVGATYTYSFGQTTTLAVYLDQRDAILVAGGAGAKSVSFKPERFY